MASRPARRRIKLTPLRILIATVLIGALILGALA
jgi:hypothetical protein